MPAPSLRLITHPEPGLGFDATLRINSFARCFLAAESYIHGGSQLAFGLEPSGLSWLRLQLAPSTKLSARLSVPITEFKEIQGSVETTLYDRGSFLRMDFSSLGAAFKSVRGGSVQGLEMRHRMSVSGVLLDDKQRRMLREAVGEIKARAIAADRAGIGSAVERRGKRALKRWKELPDLDPRDGESVSRKRALERGVMQNGEIVERLKALREMRKAKSGQGAGTGTTGEGEESLEGKMKKGGAFNVAPQGALGGISFVESNRR